MVIANIGFINQIRISDLFKNPLIILITLKSVMIKIKWVIEGLFIHFVSSYRCFCLSFFQSGYCQNTSFKLSVGFLQLHHGFSIKFIRARDSLRQWWSDRALLIQIMVSSSNFFLKNYGLVRFLWKLNNSIYPIYNLEILLFILYKCHSILASKPFLGKTFIYFWETR